MFLALVPETLPRTDRYGNGLADGARRQQLPVRRPNLQTIAIFGAALPAPRGKPATQLMISPSVCPQLVRGDMLALTRWAVFDPELT